MIDHSEIIRIQGYLRESARLIYESMGLPPFTLFFHPTNTFKYFNYAIPDDDSAGVQATVFQAMRKAFQERGRTARLEFFEAFAPGLPAALRKNGFLEEARQWSMLCTPSSLRPVPPVDGLVITDLDRKASWEDTREFIAVQGEGFNPQGKTRPTETEIQHKLERLRSGSSRALLARINDQPVSAAEFGKPIAGVTEITGIATLPDYRRRGLAAQLTAQALKIAFSMGVQTACLTAADENAGHVYAKVGFSPFSIMLAYIDSQDDHHEKSEWLRSA